MSPDAEQGPRRSGAGRAHDPEPDVSARLPLVTQADRAAFDALVAGYWDPIMRFFWKRVPRHIAEELSQEVFVSVYRAVRKGRGPAQTDAVSWQRYLFSCARNQMIDHWRRSKTRPPARALTDLVGEERAGFDPAADPARDAPAGPLVSQEQRTAIRDCLDQLDAVSRTICWLLFVEDKSKREIARELDIAESSTRVKVVEALKALRRCLERKGVSITPEPPR